MSKLQSILNKYPNVFSDLDEVSAPASSFETSNEPSLPMMARITDRWSKIGPSVITAVRELADTVNGQRACSLLHQITNMHESEEATSGSLDEIDQLVLRRRLTRLTIVHEIAEGNNDALPQGVHTPVDPALNLQELHVKIGRVLSELHALATSTVGPEKTALTMLFHEVNTAHNEIQNILSCQEQVSINTMSEALDHFMSVHSELLAALEPYSTSNPSVSRAPYQLKSAMLGE